MLILCIEAGGTGTVAEFSIIIILFLKQTINWTLAGLRNLEKDRWN